MSGRRSPTHSRISKYHHTTIVLDTRAETMHFRRGATCWDAISGKESVELLQQRIEETTRVIVV